MVDMYARAVEGSYRGKAKPTALGQACLGSDQHLEERSRREEKGSLPKSRLNTLTKILLAVLTKCSDWKIWKSTVIFMFPTMSLIIIIII